MRSASFHFFYYINNSSSAIFFFLCALSAFVVQSSFSEERVTNFRATDAKLESDYPSIAWTGSALGLAWMDGRDGNEEIYFRLVDPAGRRLGPEVRLTDSANWDYQPQLVWTGSEFGLLWVHERRVKRDIYFVRLSESGGKLGAPIRILNQGMIEKATRLAWTGRGYGIVWSDYRPGNAEIFFRPLDPFGQPSGAEARVSEGQGLSEPGALLWTGSSFTLAYLDRREGSPQVYWVRLAENGGRLGLEQKLSSGGDCTLPSLAWNGSALAAVWTERQGIHHQVMAAVIRDAGEGTRATGDTRAPSVLTTDSSDKIQAAVAVGASGFGISFWARSGTNRVLHFLSLPTAGSPAAGARPLTPPRRAEAELQASFVCPALSLVFDGSTFDIAWGDLKEEMNSEIYLTRVFP